MRKSIGVLVAAALLPWKVHADLQAGFFDAYRTTGTPETFQTLSPTVRKWYLPQTLYHLYGWKNYEYTNYARENYSRYVDIFLQGDRYYDIYGNFITRGWQIYDWRQRQPADFGNSILKNPRFSSWFSSVLISSASKGQLNYSLTIGDLIRTTLTPMTFSKPAFNGIQFDVSSDKYAFTFITSRVDNPANVFGSNETFASSETIFTNLMGGRATVQLGDFTKFGVTYVNAAHGNSRLSIQDASLTGSLGGRLNADNVRRIVVRLGDDSPEDGEGGALLFRERVFVDGVEHVEIEPSIDGGIRRRGLLEANGADIVTLSYDIERDFVAGVRDEISDFKEAKKIEIELVVGNDYRIDATSNMQTNSSGETVFLPVERSQGNIKDGSNQRVVRFQYGLPTANEIYGFTLEVSELAGFNLRSEFDVNRRHRKFPNQNILSNQALDTDRSTAWYVTASRLMYPWFFFAESYSMDAEYSTSMPIPDQRGFIDYENDFTFLYEFVDDNDDQDRFPDWRRRTTGGSNTTQGRQTIREADREVFPGLDENNDLVNDFNQNDNEQPDYDEAFLRYQVDAPEFLFGTDMNSNGVVDRFENDTEPDFPYQRDHRGYNLYVGAELTPGTKITVGRLDEKLISRGNRSKSTYGLFTYEDEFPRYDVKIRFMEFLRFVKDDIPNDLIQWVQNPFSSGGMQDVPDRLIAQNTTVNSTYLAFSLNRLQPLNISGKFKWDHYFQHDEQAKDTRNESFTGFILRADYPWQALQTLTLIPKWKQTLTRRVPTDRLELRRSELSEIFFLMGVYEIIPGSFYVESGVEWEIIHNLRKKPDPAPPSFVEDFNTLTLATQLTNKSDYQGYILTANVGVRVQRQNFKAGSETNFLSFVTVFAGLN
jgi:hypothetical protein